MHSGTCSECSALWADSRDCAMMLGELTAWEWSDPELGALHFLIVATFNLQHPSRFTDAAMAKLRSAFIQHLYTGLPVTRIRDIHARIYNGSASVLKPMDQRVVQSRDWSMTIADVHVGGPEGAAERVKACASAVRKEL